MKGPEADSGEYGQQKSMRIIERGKDTKWVMGPTKNVSYANCGLES